MQSTKRLMYALAVIQLILPFCLQNSFYQPHRDEFLYLAEGHHMAWGFMEVPPLLSVFAWLTNAFGASMFWIKIWSVLFASFTFLLTGRIVLSLGGKKFALFLCWLPLALGGYLRLFFLFQPNFLDVFFWTSMAFGLIRFLQTGKNKWLYWFGISAGLGMMSKYSVAFYLLSLLAGLLFTPQRKIFLNKHFYFASLLALLIFLPNLNWQYQHRWPVIFHMQELQDEQLKFNNYSDFILSQLAMNLPFIYIWVAGLIYTGFRNNGKQFRFLAWAFLFVILLLMVLHGKDYYALGVYPVLFAFGGFAFEKLTEMRMRWLRFVSLAFSVGLALFALPLTMPLAKPELLARYYQKTHLSGKEGFIWEDRKPHPLPQDYGDMIGWKELALQTGAVYNSIPPAERENTVVYCRGYFTAGALNYYRAEARLPEVISDNASFLFWMPDTYHVKNLILVGRHFPQPDDKVFTQFAKISVKDSVNIPLFRENGMKIILCENPTDSIDSYIETSVAALKNQYRR